MNRRKTMICIAALCAMAIYALSAQGALATSGSTMFTCVAGSGTNAHCDPGSSGNFTHQAVAANTTTELTGTGGEQVFNSTLLGGLIEIEIVATAVHVVEGTIVNTPNTPMDVSGTAKLDYTNVTDNAGCGIVGNTLLFNAMKFTTNANREVTFEPNTGSVFATIHTEHCGNLNIEGTVTAQTSGSTLRTTAADAGLTIGGEPMTLEGEITLEAGEEVGGVKVHHPISLTTTAS